ncbi:PREDICTED: uncharacterized protein LOC18608970 [Theobroma cacao]|uniref:Uncharacterized protein LOC18608970 n=1 Tax=Theobroma cacao TaxID=3641 RepID=A0AB32VII0_THECC|nr:PREDICTED: uncharacterized protein LOC18608970 [Theobroma cacao]
MGSTQGIELINLAIQKLIQEKRIRHTSASADQLSEEDEDDQLLTRLLSQLESLRGDSTLNCKQSEGSILLEEVTSPMVDEAEAKRENGSRVECGCGEIGAEEIVKELRAIQRQNTVTHCLLSVMIVVTLVWQLSEVSLFLKVKNGFSHPFRSFGSMLLRMLPNPTPGINMQDADNNSSSTKTHHNHPLDPSLPSVRMPELPHLEFPHLGQSTSSEGH